MIRVRRGRAPDVLTRNRARWLKDLQQARTVDARKLVLDTPRALLNDEPITLPEPRSIVRARKKVFGIF